MPNCFTGFILMIFSTAPSFNNVLTRNSSLMTILRCEQYSFLSLRIVSIGLPIWYNSYSDNKFTISISDFSGVTFK